MTLWTGDGDIASPIQFSGWKLDIVMVFRGGSHNPIPEAVAALRVERAGRVAY